MKYILYGKIRYSYLLEGVEFGMSITGVRKIRVE